MASSTASLLVLLQLVDSSFPIGTFAHSYGLEQLVRDRHVHDATTLERFVRSTISLQLASSEARAVATAHDAALRLDFDAVLRIDERLCSSRAPAELRDAGTTAGRRFLEEVAAHPEGRGGLVPDFRTAVLDGRSPGTHAVALGVAAAAFGVAAEEAAAGLLFSTSNALVQAAMRLLPISHRDAQATLYRARTMIASAADGATDAEPLCFASFHPLQEIASMRHANASVRFFAS